MSLFEGGRIYLSIESSSNKGQIGPRSVYGRSGSCLGGV